MKNNDETPEEKLNRIRIENEALKKQLTEEHGANFANTSNTSHLPPDIENQFLSNIMAFEKAMKSASEIKLYDFLGQPKFVHPDDLTDAELSNELKRVTQLMASKQVVLDTICKVDDRELYRFITQELFQNEINEIQIPGMTTNYIYEEFHPNHPYDIQNHSRDFFTTYLDKESDFYTTFLSGEAPKADWHIHFREAFSQFEINKFEIIDFTFDEERAVLQYYCDFVAKVESSDAWFHFVGNGEMKLVYKWDFWCVDQIVLPNSSQQISNNAAAIKPSNNEG